MGYKPGELVVERSLDVVHPDDFERVIETFAEIWDTPGIHTPIVFQARHKDGSWLHME
jgi:hypothetical protein